MKILHVGISGIVGTAAYEALKRRGHDVVAAHRHASDHPVDMLDPEIHSSAARKGRTSRSCRFDCRARRSARGINSPENSLSGLLDKFMGQVELDRRSAAYATQGGSFTLTSGILGREPVRDGILRLPSMAHLKRGREQVLANYGE
jgi:nucleoside-diphosphate-sugar epimerase